eukprot:TRINITY_DN3972_c0_g1_i1.p2 TRINITY_DN3972_c0_g1~~TRINITY_DN3972_c0_g1_i1.p2  ORF type:complete len:132 (+),score=10.36 TRINITY_DN3972_c0_g1_i1:2031-2426(+)
MEDLPLCVTSYVSQPGDTCDSITKKYFKRDATRFFSFNLGINCDNLVQSMTDGTPGLNAVVAGQEICITTTSYGTIKRGCKHRVFEWQRGDKCLAVLRKFFSRSQQTFKKWNKGVICQDKTLYPGATLCRP